MSQGDGSNRRSGDLPIGYEWGSLENCGLDESIGAGQNAPHMRDGLLVDDEAWALAGRELKRCDPQRYIAILQVVQDLCAIHRDPIGAVRTATGTFVFAKSKNDRDPD